MRIGELAGLKGEYVTDSHIIVNGQYGNYGYTDTKSHKARCVPIPKKIKEELDGLIRINGNGYVFSKDGGEKPVSKMAVRGAFIKALDILGIDEAERKRRGLTFHSWRHFFNTSLLLADISDVKVQAMTGHSSLKMTKRYTHIKSSDLNEITAIQEKMLDA
jgi:integrase